VNGPHVQVGSARLWRLGAEGNPIEPYGFVTSGVVTMGPPSDSVPCVEAKTVTSQGPISLSLEFTDIGELAAALFGWASY
jgi:hypothetical protein